MKRYLTNVELNRIRNEEDMLKGNINRMCVTDSLKELYSMYDFALKRISRIYNINLEKFLKDDSEYIEDHKNESCENCSFYSEDDKCYLLGEERYTSKYYTCGRWTEKVRRNEE